MKSEPVAIVTTAIAVLNILLLVIFKEQMGTEVASALAVVGTAGLGWLARSQVWSKSSLGKVGRDAVSVAPSRGPRAGEPL